LDEVQYNAYNSQVKDFPIKFEKEKIAKSGLFVAKKKYSTRCLWIEGEKKEEIKTTGLEVVRGDSSEAIRDRLKDIMSMILRDKPDDSITKKISQYRKELLGVYPEEIAANIGVNNLNKYINKDGKSIKGTPWHVKGVANYRFLLKKLGIENQYEDVKEGYKCKVVYVKKNPFNMETISFLRWPREFSKVVNVDMEKMVDKFFVKKVKILLEPMNRLDMLNSNKSLDLFF
jgi:DNA polymerase elongation subunit (family B)